MKHICITTLAALVCGSAFAQGPEGPPPEGGPPEGGRGGRGPRGDRGAMIAERYKTVAAYDTDKSGTFGDEEKAALKKAVEDGKLNPPGRRGGPEGEKPPADEIVTRTVELYETIAKYDADKDGKLSKDEGEALKKAVEAGEVKLPMGPPPGGEGGKGKGEGKGEGEGGKGRGPGGRGPGGPGGRGPGGPGGPGGQ